MLAGQGYVQLAPSSPRLTCLYGGAATIARMQFTKFYIALGLLGCKGAPHSVNVNVIIYPRNFNVGDIFTIGMNSSDPRPHILSSAGSSPTLSVLTGSRTYPALSDGDINLADITAQIIHLHYLSLSLLYRL